MVATRTNWSDYPDASYFDRDQNYFLQQMRNHNQALHVAGIIGDGLDVTARKGSRSITVQPGIAFSEDGQLIRLEKATTVDLRKGDAGKTILVVIAYKEVGVKSDSDDELNKIANGAEVTFVGPTSRSKKHVRLAKLALDGDGKIAESDLSVRTASGAVLQPDIELRSLVVQNETVQGELDVASNLTIGGLTTTDSLTVNKATVLGQTLAVSGAATFKKDLTVDGAASVGSLSVGGRTTTDSLTVKKATVLSQTLAVSGAASFQKNLTVVGAASVGSLSVGGRTTTDSLTVTKATVLGQTLAVSGAATFKKTLTVDGAASVGSLSVGGRTTTDSLTVNKAAVFLGPTLTVSGAATFQKNLTVDGAASAGSLSVGGRTTADSLTVNKATKLNGNATIGGVLTVSGTATVSALKIGRTSIGEAELSILKQLLNGRLVLKHLKKQPTLTIYFDGNNWILGQSSNTRKRMCLSRTPNWFVYP